MQRTFIVISEFGEILDVSLHLKYAEKQEVLLYIKDSRYKDIGKGMIEHIDDWHDYLGQDCIFVFDGCAAGKTQDWLRSQGEYVFGGSERGDKLENDRQLGQRMFKEAGFKQPPSHNFKDIDAAKAFVKANKDKRWILKQNGDAPKSLNHMGKFDGNVDMLKHLENLKTDWDETSYGAFDCDLMEVVEGTEMAASAFWNGSDWMRDKEGRVVGYLNFEEKKEFTSGLGETTGETGTTFLGVNDDDKTFKKIIVNKVVEKWLKESGFRGVFDINGTLTKEGDYVAFEPTMRFGVPASSYEFIEGMVSKTADLIADVAMGESRPVEVKQTIGMVIVVAAKPYPLEGNVSPEDTSVGEELWLTSGGEPADANIWSKRFRRIHPYNFLLDEETGEYKVATPSGYMFTVTATGESVAEARERIIEDIENLTYLSGAKYRKDIGERVEGFIEKRPDQKPRIQVDFDGVIHEKQKDENSMEGKMIKGADESIKTLVKEGNIVEIFTARKDIKAVKKWMDENFPDWKDYIDAVTSTKRHSVAYIDDNAYRFDSWKDVLSQIKA